MILKKCLKCLKTFIKIINIEFHLEDVEGDYAEKTFSDIVVESASKVYENQRNIDFEHSKLKEQASNILNKLFGISYDFSLTLLEIEITVNLVPRITVTLNESCDVEIKEDNKYFYIEIENGFSIEEKGSLDINFVYEYLDNIFNLTEKFNKRFNGLVPDGKIIFKFKGNKLQISFVLSYSKDFFSCSGTVTITIEPNNNTPFLEPDYNEEKERERQPFNFGEVIVSTLQEGLAIVNSALHSLAEIIKNPIFVVSVNIIIAIIAYYCGIPLNPISFP